jgi:hypothetical protein
VKEDRRLVVVVEVLTLSNDENMLSLDIKSKSLELKELKLGQSSSSSSSSSLLHADCEASSKCRVRCCSNQSSNDFRAMGNDRLTAGSVLLFLGGSTIFFISTST